MILYSALFFSLLSLSASKRLPTDECPILGPAFPSNFNIEESEALSDAKAGFPKVIEALFSSGALNGTDTSFAIDVFSTATNSSIYSYYHAAPGLNGSLTAGVLDEDTIFRIGSVSKLFTVYAIVAFAGMDVLDHPAVNYIPELRSNFTSDSIGRIKWEDITVGALASQQGGTGGFEIETIGCFIVDPTKCTTQEFLDVMRNKKRPVVAPFSTSIYSDSGFGVLGVVLQRLTGLPYEQALQSVLSSKLGLNSTSTTMPATPGLNAIIPGNESAWGFDNQITAPSGGIYSTNADLRKIGLSIFQHQLLDSASTRNWMKPRGHTAALTTSIGAPWEIERLAINVTANSTRYRISDLYTKLGGQPSYSGVFALSPDHGLGYSILVAGPRAIPARYPLQYAVGEVFVSAAEHAAAENAAINYAGVFVDEAAQGTNITLTVDDDHPGLGVKSMFVNGTEWRSNFFGLGVNIPPAKLTVRLYPSGLDSPTYSASSWNKTSGFVQVSFRAVPQILPLDPRAEVEGGAGLFDGGCQTWQSLGFYPVDEVVLEVVNGKVHTVTSIGAQTIMKRVE